MVCDLGSTSDYCSGSLECVEQKYNDSPRALEFKDQDVVHDRYTNSTGKHATVHDRHSLMMWPNGLTLTIPATISGFRINQSRTLEALLISEFDELRSANLLNLTTKFVVQSFGIMENRRCPLLSSIWTCETLFPLRKRYGQLEWW